MQHITKDSKRMQIRGLTHFLFFGPSDVYGWLQSSYFEEYSMEIKPGQPACPNYGCKVYRHKVLPVQAVFHNSAYGCPRGL